MNIDVNLLNLLQKEEKYRLLRNLLEHLHFQHNLTENELMSLYAQCSRNEKVFVPLSVFYSNLTPTQSLVKYLKEESHLTLAEISRLIERDQRGLWSIYEKVRRKKQLDLSSPILIPISIFANRNLSILENLVQYLKTAQHMTPDSIAKILGKKRVSIQNLLSKVRRK